MVNIKTHGPCLIISYGWQFKKNLAETKTKPRNSCSWIFSTSVVLDEELP